MVTTFSPKKDLTPTVPVGKVENGEGDKKEEGPPFSDLALSLCPRGVGDSHIGHNIIFLGRSVGLFLCLPH